MPSGGSTVFEGGGGPPLFKVALIRSSCPGAACCPAVPSLGEQPTTGTMLSRGMLSTVAPCRPGEMCSSIKVSERPPGVELADPPTPPWPARVPEPSTRMFSALLYLGGWLPISPALRATILAGRRGGSGRQAGAHNTCCNRED